MAARFSLEFHRVSASEPIPAWLDRETVVEFLHQQLSERGAAAADVRRALQYALAPSCGQGGLLLLAAIGDRLTGAALALRSGLEVIGAGHRLVYVAVLPELRGRGLGKRLVTKVAEQTSGGVEVLLAEDDRATSLFSGLGFGAKGVLRVKP